MAKVAFLGLGVMGYPMAGHLAAKGGTTSPSTTAPPPRPTLGGAARRHKRADADGRGQGQEIVFACVGNDDDLRAVTLGAGRRLRRHGGGRHLRRPHHRLGRRSRANSHAAAKKAASISSTRRCRAARPAPRTAR